MQIKIITATFLLYFCSFNLFGQDYEAIEKEAGNIFLINENNSGTIKGLKTLKAVLFSDNDNLKDIEELRNQFTQFEVESLACL